MQNLSKNVGLIKMYAAEREHCNEADECFVIKNYTVHLDAAEEVA